MMNQQKNEKEITVTSLSSVKTFANQKELKGFVDGVPNQWSPLELAAKHKLDALESGGTPPPSELPDPKPPTRLDEQVAGAARELEVAEEKWLAARLAWLSRARVLENEVPGRLRKARGNLTELSRVDNWVNDGQGEVGRLKRATEIAEKKLKRARAKYNKLKLAADQLRREQDILISVPDHPDSPLTLAEFEEFQRLEKI